MEHQIDTEKPMLTEHFSYLELNLKNAEARVINNYEKLCELIMEPIRDRFGPIVITSARRFELENMAAGGKVLSYHLAYGGKAAIDFKPFRKSKLIQIWDWLRLDSDLMFDKIILERAKSDIIIKQIPLIIHVQYDRLNPPRRLAYEGFTGASDEYTQVNVNPIKNIPRNNDNDIDV
jgi:hypothetical protein